MLYDVFICHASEDKDSFVRPLAKRLRQAHVEVWYDEFSLRVGDSLRESIDKGLSKSRFGVVVLSPYFFKKRWPQREFEGLVAREMVGDDPVILPIWHNVTVQDLIEYSPPLADKKAIDSGRGVGAVCRELLKRLRPQESPLIVARDELVAYGISPPVITDEWWLDVIAASTRIPCWGFVVPEESSWGRWTFPIPNLGLRGPDRGITLAWTAMQMQWEEHAEAQRITQITHPHMVLKFIKSQPGLSDACHNYPEMLAIYAPQLTIRGLGGEFEADFDELLKERRSRETLALRLPGFGGIDISTIACNYVQGPLGGPETKYYESFDYVIWFLSSASHWMPSDVRNVLISGMKKWAVWPSYGAPLKEHLWLEELLDVKQEDGFALTKESRASLRNWIGYSLSKLGIEDNPSIILRSFLNQGFIESLLRSRTLQQNRPDTAITGD